MSQDYHCEYGGKVVIYTCGIYMSVYMVQISLCSIVVKGVERGGGSDDMRIVALSLTILLRTAHTITAGVSCPRPCIITRVCR